MPEIHYIRIPLENGWDEPAEWLIERLGAKYTDAGRSTRGPDSPGYYTAAEDIIAAPEQWDVCYDPGTHCFIFMIQPKDVALLFKLTFGGA